MPPVLEAQSFNHLTTREVRKSATFFFYSSLVVWALITLLHARQATLSVLLTYLCKGRLCALLEEQLLKFYLCLCKDHMGCFQVRPGTDPAAKEADKCGLPVCLRGRNCAEQSIVLASFFFFFFKASLKDKQVELRLVVSCLRSQHY